MSSRAEVEARWERRSVSRVSGVVGVVVVVVEGSAGEGIFSCVLNIVLLEKLGELVLLRVSECVVERVVGWVGCSVVVVVVVVVMEIGSFVRKSSGERGTYMIHVRCPTTYYNH